jgi:hypothetical protein
MGKLPNYTIKDSFMQTLNDFDIVAISDNDGGIGCCTLGLYFQTYVLVYEDFFNRSGTKHSFVTYKRNNLYNIGRNAGMANRQAIEIGELPGEYMMRAVIKIECLTEDMMYYKAELLEDIKASRVTTRVPRKLISSLLEAARQSGQI